MLKSLVGAFLDLESEESFKPALLENSNGDMEPVYVIEDRGRPRVWYWYRGRPRLLRAPSNWFNVNVSTI
jgi:hypothetical protein